MLTDNDLKSYIKGYLANRKISYTRLDKHDRAIEVLINENSRLNNIINKAIEYMEHLEWVEMSFNILGKERIRGTTKDFVNELLDILKGSDNK